MKCSDTFYILTTLEPIQKDPHLKFQSSRLVLGCSIILLPTQSNMILAPPETKEYPFKLAVITDPVSTDPISCWWEHGASLGSSPKVSQALATSIMLNLSQSDLFIFVSTWLSGRFLFTVWCPHPHCPAMIYFLSLLANFYIIHYPVIMMYWPDLWTLLKAYVYLFHFLLRLVGLSRGLHLPGDKGLTLPNAL